jgi:hypothetical protein
MGVTAINSPEMSIFKKAATKIPESVGGMCVKLPAIAFCYNILNQSIK